MQNKIDIFEKIATCLTYIFLGIPGIIWLIISNVFFKKNPKPISLYHIYQSILLWMLITACGFILSMFLEIIIKIPHIGSWIGNIMLFFNTPIYFGMSIINLFITLIIIYLTLGAILGRYSKLPLISRIVKWNIDRLC